MNSRHEIHPVYNHHDKHILDHNMLIHIERGLSFDHNMLRHIEWGLSFDMLGDRKFEHI